MKALILAGGGGTRLWPVSRKGVPKQVHSFVGEKTLLQNTYDRVRKGFDVKDIYLSTNAMFRETMLAQLPDILEKHLFLEPKKKDTAPAIGFAAAMMAREDAEAVFVTVNSDAHIADEDEYLRVLRVANRVVEEKPNSTVLVGIKPVYPETGYGYMEMGKEEKVVDGARVFHAMRFVEKPNVEKAREYIARGGYVWNPAMFVWRVSHLLSLYQQFLPAMFEELEKIRTAEEKDLSHVIATAFDRMEAISIDYGILEKIQENMLVIPADFGWADVGHWRAVKDALGKNEGENLVKGKYIGIESEGNVVYGDGKKLIATCGVSNMIIVDTGDALLVCPKDRAQEVKRVVEEAEKRGWSEFI